MVLDPTGSGLITYWEFNSREFCIQIYTALSRIEELSRNILASDGCGLSSEQGLNLEKSVLKTARSRFKKQGEELGGNRFVDALDFGHVNDALKSHLQWRQYLEERVGILSNAEYQSRYDLKNLRNAVMHGRAPLPTYSAYKAGTRAVGEMMQLIGYLDAYILSELCPVFDEDE